MALYMQDDSCAKEEGNEEATSALLLSRASVDDQHSFVKAWADVLAVCASELQHASNVWSQAQNESVQLDFLANHEGCLFNFTKCDASQLVQLHYSHANSLNLVHFSQLKGTLLQLGKYMWFL